MAEPPALDKETIWNLVRSLSDGMLQRARRLFAVPGSESQLRLWERADLQGAGGTGGVVWPAAEFLVSLLATDEGRTLVEGQKVIELGCGCGLSGMSADILGAKQVLLTDRRQQHVTLVHEPDGSVSTAPLQGTQLELTAANVEANRGVLPNTEVAELSWGDAGHIAACQRHFCDQNDARCVDDVTADAPDCRADVVLGSDVSHVEALHSAFFCTARDMTAAGGMLLLTHHDRALFPVERLIEVAEAVGFQMEQQHSTELRHHGGRVLHYFHFTMAQ